MGKINSKKKGNAGELEWAHFLKDRGLTARRTQQFSGKTDDASDVVCEELRHIHFEVKRVERLLLYPSLEQAIRDARSRLPVVAHRANRRDWVCITRAHDFVELLMSIEMFKALDERGNNETQ